jgi:hypothetical protein
MIINAKQLELNLIPNVQTAIITFVKECRLWQGTTTELSKVLSLNINSRVLSMELKKSEEELNNHGILIVRKKIHGKHIISISMNSDTHRITHSAIKHVHPNQSIVQHDNFATPYQKETISFPCEWKYATITALSEEEKNEVNRVRHQGRKQYQKPCSLCGEEGHTEFRKISDGNSSLICKPCAENYVRSAKNNASKR